MNFIKKASHESLICEKRGLDEISSYYQLHHIKTPKVITLNDQELILEHIEPCNGSEQKYQTLGENLAKMHQIKFDQFGHKHDNFIGLNPQKNYLSSSWSEFFLEARLKFQIHLVTDKRLQQKLLHFIDVHKDKIKELLEEHNPCPSLVHGDLWSGNVLFTKQDIFLIDPSLYYADREVDMAMTELFGGFKGSFYFSYIQNFPLHNNYSKRKVIYNLYHYLNHYNLFGNSYASGITNSIEFIKGI